VQYCTLLKDKIKYYQGVQLGKCCNTIRIYYTRYFIIQIVLFFVQQSNMYLCGRFRMRRVLKVQGGVPLTQVDYKLKRSFWGKSLNRRRNLSKSKYINGLQCSKLLWVSINEAARLPAYDAATQHVFDQGHMIGSWHSSCIPAVSGWSRRTSERTSGKPRLL